MFGLDTPLARIEGIGPRFTAKLKKLSIETVRDLVFHFPFRYEDFSEIYAIADLEPGQHATVQGVIREVDSHRSWQRRVPIVEATLADASGEIRAVWFNQPYLKTTLRPGKLANFSGKVSFSDGELYLSHPTYELVGRHETKHTARLVPIYPETKGLTSKGLRFLIQPVLKNLAPSPEWIPDTVLAELRFPELNGALHAIHFPATIEEALAAKRRFAFEDLFLLQLMNMKEKMKLAQEQAPAIAVSIDKLKRMLAELPFALTQSQKRSLWEIIQGLGQPRPMNRLLQGDVGSGKTVVAALAALLAAQNGYQAAFMAPTEVLAHQHYETMKKLLARMRAAHQVPVGLLAAGNARVIRENDAEEPMKKEALAKALTTGEIMIAIGTHALIQKTVSFKNPGLIIIDEQHRFGVGERAALGKRRGKKQIPHFLSMSATPIPRTLTLTIFGDLDLSTIDELPAGRKSIETKVIPPEGRAASYRFIRAEIRKGRQAFVICPRIEPDSEEAKQKEFRTLELKSVKEEFDRLSKTVFPDLRIAMLHGQMPARGGSASGGKPTKEGVMRDFKDGKIDILVATSVIEVGVDVPNATIMMIEGADRFGLSQIYQFRGRVGRGEHQSHCFLFTDSTSKTVRERLKAILTAKNGFELAERDLEIRGPGEFLGEKQTGIPDVAMEGLRDITLIKESRASAVPLLQNDPLLKRYPLLRTKLDAFTKRIHRE